MLNYVTTYMNAAVM